ncbi:hypothetical protein D3C77_593820 [compost metagenome]
MAVARAASTEKLPLPCRGTQAKLSSCTPAMESSSWRTSAVTRLKAPSHEPQSRSMASLVALEVVSGPGVSR